MNENVIITSNDGYNQIDGRNAYHSDIRCLTLGVPRLEEKMQIAAQIRNDALYGKNYLHIMKVKQKKYISRDAII